MSVCPGLNVWTWVDGIPSGIGNWDRHKQVRKVVYIHTSLIEGGRAAWSLVWCGSGCNVDGSNLWARYFGLRTC